jgi:hypothetical protein
MRLSRIKPGTEFETDPAAGRFFWLELAAQAGDTSLRRGTATCLYGTMCEFGTISEFD